MPTMSAVPTTADELLALHEPGRRHELVHGELRTMRPAGFWHGGIAAALTARLCSHVERHHLGIVFAAETGFLLARDPDTVLAPDVAFVRRSRVPPPGPGYFPDAPDLAVEVVSASDRATSLAAKTRLWLAHGATTVWIVDPVARTVAIHRRDEPPHLLHENDILTATDLLPGFAVVVRELFPTVPC